MTREPIGSQKRSDPEAVGDISRAELPVSSIEGGERDSSDANAHEDLSTGALGRHPVQGSPIYQRNIAALPADDISRQVWDFTPWIVEAFTGSHDDDHGRRWQQMHQWCSDHLGPPAQPFGNNPRPGNWRSGNATVFGWTWWGFVTEGLAERFLAAWPAPEPAGASDGALEAPRRDAGGALSMNEPSS